MTLPSSSPSLHHQNHAPINFRPPAPVYHAPIPLSSSPPVHYLSSSRRQPTPLLASTLSISQLPVQVLQWSERVALHLPPTQQLLLLTNRSKTECYSNAGVVAVTSNPVIASLLASLWATDGLVVNLRALSLLPPDRVGSLRQLRSRVADFMPGVAAFKETKHQQDAHEWMVSLLEALEKALAATGDPREVRTLRYLTQMEVTKTRECAVYGTQHSYNVTELETVISLPVVHPVTNQPLTSLADCLKFYLQPETLTMNCQHSVLANAPHSSARSPSSQLSSSCTFSALASTTPPTKSVTVLSLVAP